MGKRGVKEALQRSVPSERKGRIVWCEIQECDLDGENGQELEGVTATCSRCGNETESFGTSDRSVKRCLVLLRETCPRGEVNFYADAAQQPPPRDPRPVAARAREALDRIFPEASP